MSFVTITTLLAISQHKALDFRQIPLPRYGSGFET